jgi:hypothetical protein
VFRALRGVRFKGSDVFPCGDDNGASGRGDPGGGSTLQVIIFSLESDELPFAHVSRARWWQVTCINCSRTCSPLVVSHLVTHVLRAWSHRTAPHRTAPCAVAGGEPRVCGVGHCCQARDSMERRCGRTAVRKRVRSACNPRTCPRTLVPSTVRRLSGANHTRGLM